MEIIQGKKYRWKVAPSDMAVVKEVASRHSLSMPVAQALCVRGFVSKDEINSFLFTSERDVPHAELLKDAGIAAERILRAIKDKEKILIFGDYDVDGITSTSLLLVALLPLGATINYYLPNRY